MKKLVLVLCLVLVAAFTVQASDLTTSGSYMVIGESSDAGFTAAAVDRYVSNVYHQRMRVGLNWQVNDNVSTHLRGDFAEMSWGNNSVSRPEAGHDTIMVDLAYAKIKSGALTMTIGQQGGKWGLGSMWNDQFQGMMADIDIAPVTIKFLYSKNSENGTNTANSQYNDNGSNSFNDDDDVYGVAVAYANDAFSGQVSFATLRQRDAVPDEATTSGLSLTVIAPINDMLKISAEGTYFSGDNGNNTDYFGQQMVARLDVKANDMLSLGVSGLWAAGDDTDTQVTNLGNFVGFCPLDYQGALAAYDNYFAEFGTFAQSDVFDLGTNDGVIGIIADAKFAATKAITLYAKIGYVEPNDSALTTNPESILVANTSIDYAWMPAVTVSAGAAYAKPDYQLATSNDDPLVQYHLRFGVSF